MVKPIDPSKPTGGDGNEKYNPNPKRGPGAFDEILEKAKSDRKPSGGSGSAGIPKLNRDLTRNYKSGGDVSEASHKKALEKAGFYVKGKTKSEREKIVSKVTTKPQRLGMVEKLFSAKKMNSGGMASKRADGIAQRGKTKGRMV